LLGVSRGKQVNSLSGYGQVLKPNEDVEVHVSNPIPNDPNSATVVTYQFGVPSIADRIHLSLLGEFIEQPVFDTLRTEHQLGYVVWGFATIHGSIGEVRVIVQGFRESPDVVQALIEGTVQNLTSSIAAISQDDFQIRKGTLRTSLLKEPATMSQFKGKFWGQIWDEEYCFNKQQLQLQRLEDPSFVSAAPLLDAWRRTVDPNTQRKVTVKLYSSKASQAAEANSLVATRRPVKLVTNVDSQSVSMLMSNESYWPHVFKCE